MTRDCKHRWVETHLVVGQEYPYKGVCKKCNATRLTARAGYGRDADMWIEYDKECDFCGQPKERVMMWDDSDREYGPHHICRECLEPLRKELEE